MSDQFTINELIECARREVRLRVHVYPKLIKSKRMQPEQAEREIAMMRAIIERLATEQIE